MSKKDQNEQSRYWCVTIYDGKWGFPRCSLDKIKYAIYQRELCPDTGRAHFQCYFELYRPVSFGKGNTGLPKILGLKSGDYHAEQRRGTAVQARDYCKKDKSRDTGTDCGPFEHGRFTGEDDSPRSDLLMIKDLLDKGASIEEISEKYFETWVRNYRAFYDYVKMKTKAYEGEREVIVFYGEGGTGKTRTAIEEIGSAGYYIKENGNKWWNGYLGEKNVIIDDFSEEGFPFRTLLRVLDRYKVSVEVKGGTIPLAASRIYITADRPIEEWYIGLTDSELKQLKRRITRIQRFV